MAGEHLQPAGVTHQRVRGVAAALWVALGGCNCRKGGGFKHWESIEGWGWCCGGSYWENGC